MSAIDLVDRARRALVEDGEDPALASIQVSVIPRRKVVRVAYDAPFAYGRAGARWYERHHALARLLSEEARVTVHAYVYLPDEFEQVTGYGAGRNVGGEKLVYDEVDLDEDDLEPENFERVKSRWPIGHLAYVYGVNRDELLKLPRSRSILLHLDGRDPGQKLQDLLPAQQA